MKRIKLSGRIRAIARSAPDFGIFAAASLPLAMLVLLLMALAPVAEAAGQSSEQQTSEQQASCEGESLRASLQAEHPERYEDARKAAAAVENGQGLLWRVEKPGTEPSWLFGTMHVTDPRVTQMPDNARERLARADIVVIETTDILDPEKAQAALLAKPELTMFTDGTTLQSLLEGEDLELVRDELASRGIPLAAVSRLKPWMIAGLVSTPECEHARKTGGADILDKKIADLAKAGGKELLGLETMGEQLAAMESLPLEFHVRGLVETIRMGDLMPDVMATMTDLYLSQDIALIMPVIRAASPEGLDDDAEAYARFEERIITMRNHVMAERMTPILQQGSAFVAIGAMHLPGEEGLVALLRDAGYTVTGEKPPR